VLLNQVESVPEGRALSNRVSRVTERYLNVSLQFTRVVSHDNYLRKVVRKRRPSFEANPGIRSFLTFKNRAQKTDKWPVPRVAAWYPGFFTERVAQSRKGYMEMPA
jgi:flagellar biosynthesis protein FlhG